MPIDRETPGWTVTRYCAPRKKSTSCVRNACSLRLEVDAVQDQVQVVAVGLDLGMVDLGERVFDRQLVEVEDVGEESALRPVWARSRSTHTQTPLSGLSQAGSTRSTIWVDPSAACL